jgi:hypothetical protein
MEAVSRCLPYNWAPNPPRGYVVERSQRDRQFIWSVADLISDIKRGKYQDVIVRLSKADILMTSPNWRDAENIAFGT